MQTNAPHMYDVLHALLSVISVIYSPTSNNPLLYLFSAFAGDHKLLKKLLESNKQVSKPICLLSVMSSNLGWVELGVCSISV